MKFSLWTQYGALNSGPVFGAFEQSLHASGHTVVLNTFDADIHVIWSVLWNGRMASNKAVWERARKENKNVIVLEVGGIKRGTTWKVGLNGINRAAYFGPSGNDSTRANRMGLVCTPWRCDGHSILICGQHDKSLQWQDMPPMSQWVMETIEKVQACTDRTIIFRPHPRCPLPHIEHEFKNVLRDDPEQIKGSYDDFNLCFNNIYATISWSSNPGIHSVINGVPAIVGPDSLAYDVAMHNIEEITSPYMPDRQQWLNDYAWTEFTLEEIASGLPLNRLTDKLT